MKKSKPLRGGGIWDSGDGSGRSSKPKRGGGPIQDPSRRPSLPLCYDKEHEGVDERMALSIRLETDREFEEAARQHGSIRVFQNDHLIDSGGTIIRFDDNTVVVQSSVSEISYHSRRDCEFFMVRQR